MRRSIAIVSAALLCLALVMSLGRSMPASAQDGGDDSGDGGPPVMATGTLTVTKTDKVGTPLAGAEFTVSAADGTTLGVGTTDATGTAFITTGAVVDDVVTLTETIVPAGCTSLTPTQDIVVVDGGNTVTVINICEAPTGEANAFIDVEKLVCTETADNVAGTVDLFVPGEFTAAEAPDTCRAATADEYAFTLFNNDILYEGGEIVAIDTAATDATGQALLGAFVNDVIGTRTVYVAEALTGAETVDIVLTPGVTEQVLVINYVAAAAAGATGEVEIVKLYCTNDDLAGQVEFEVLGPETPVEATGVTAQAGTTQADNCTPGAAEFAIFPFGDTSAEPIAVTVGSDGLIVIDGIIPVTTDLSPHELVELSTGAKAFFDVAEGAVTKIITLNYVGSDTGDDNKDTGGDTDTGDDNKDTGTTGGDTTDNKDTDTTGDNTGTTGGDTASKDTSGGTTTTTGGGGATTLPDTGAGTGQDADYGMAFFLVLGGLAAAGVSLRRRAA